jgi:hypothetical protein
MVAGQQNKAEQKISDEIGARRHASQDPQSELLALLTADKSKLGLIT